MQTTDDTGCLTQRSQLDRLQEIADAATRERVKGLHGSERIPATAFVIGANGKESIWELDHLPLARSGQEPIQLLLSPEAALDTLVPTQTIMRILRDTEAAAVAVVAPINASSAALQLADSDHEESLIAMILRQPDSDPALEKWDFGRVAWTVRLRHVLRAARGADVKQPTKEPLARPAGAAPPPTRPAEPTTARRNHRREMREQLHRQPAAAPSWLQ